jgi:acetylornithine deacetylase
MPAPACLETGHALAVLDRLIAFDTVSRNGNRALIDWIADYLRGHGIEPLVLPDPEGTGTKANLYATIGPADRGGVVLSGHTDVVPVDDQPWTTDPFRLTERDGRWYGRGTADMKGFVALALALVPALAARDLRTPVHLAFSYDEEVGCLGVPHMIRHILEHLPRPELVVVGEPTAMRPVNAHKGLNAYRTTVTGRDGHSSAPARGSNAILYAAEIAACIGRIAADKRAGPLDARFDPPCSTINVGRIEGGTGFNIIPAQCSLVWDYRPLPGDDVAATLARLDRFIAEQVLPRLHAECPEGGVETTALVSGPALGPDPDGPAEALLRRLTGANRAGTVPFCTEAGLFQQAGIPAVVIGPGDVAQAHRPDEFITTAQLEAGAAFLNRLADSVSDESA